MKIGIFNTVRDGNTRFNESVKKYDGKLELCYFDAVPTIENHKLLKGCEAIIYTPAGKTTDEFWKSLADTGIKYVLTPTAGYDHFDLAAMKKYGLKGANVPRYSPNAISETAVGFIFALLRKFREQIHRIDKGNFTLHGLMGKEIRNQTIGIVGAGRIGLTTMKCLSGFNPQKILAYDPFQNEEVKKFASYVTLNELYAQSDIIVFHCNATKETYHMINDDSIKTMKDGVFLINVARGQLFDNDCILSGIKSGKLGGVAMDVIEGEAALKNISQGVCPIPILKELLTYENFIYTSHSAFYTDEADRNMSDITMENAYSYMTTGACSNELVK